MFCETSRQRQTDLSHQTVANSQQTQRISLLWLPQGIVEFRENRSEQSLKFGLFRAECATAIRLRRGEYLGKIRGTHRRVGVHRWPALDTPVRCITQTFIVIVIQVGGLAGHQIADQHAEQRLEITGHQNFRRLALKTGNLMFTDAFRIEQRL